MPDSYSCNVRVVSVTGNDGGFGATAVLEFEQGGGIDISPGGPDTDSVEFQITDDASQLVVEGATLKLTLDAMHS